MRRLLISLLVLLAALCSQQRVCAQSHYYQGHATTTNGKPALATDASNASLPAAHNNLNIVFFSPLDYGALCNGTNDDTSAFQTAIDNAEGNGSNNLVQLPPNNSCRTTVTLSVTASVKIVGTKFISAINLDTATTGMDIIDVGFQGSSISDVLLQDFSLTRKQADTTGIAVNTDNVAVSTYRGLYVYGNNTIGNAFNFKQISNLDLHNVWSQNVTGYCFQVAGSTTTSVSTPGPIDTLGTITGGSGYTNGTYFLGTTTSGSGTGASLEIVVSGNTVTSATLQPGNNMIGYKVGDTITAAVPGGSGFSVPVTVVGISSVDLRMDDLSRCDGGTNGLVIGDWAGGIYVYNNIFYDQSNTSIEETSTNLWKIENSFHIVGNDFDTTESAMLWLYAWDVHIVGNRFGYNFTKVMSFTGAKQVDITGNNIIGAGAMNCVDLGDGTNNPGHTASIINVSGNLVSGCNFGVNVEQGASDIMVGSNTFQGQTSYNVSLSACNLARVTIGTNNYDATVGNGIYQSSSCSAAVGENVIPALTVGSATSSPGIGNISANGLLRNITGYNGTGASAIPSCGSSQSGSFAKVTDGKASPTLGGAYAAGDGSTTQPVWCNGSGWTYR